jgi:hypothetical protein
MYTGMLDGVLQLADVSLVTVHGDICEVDLDNETVEANLYTSIWYRYELVDGRTLPEFLDADEVFAERRADLVPHSPFPGDVASFDVVLRGHVYIDGVATVTELHRSHFSLLFTGDDKYDEYYDELMAQMPWSLRMAASLGTVTGRLVVRLLPKFLQRLVVRKIALALQRRALQQG